MSFNSENKSASDKIITSSPLSHVWGTESRKVAELKILVQFNHFGLIAKAALLAIVSEILRVNYHWQAGKIRHSKTSLFGNSNVVFGWVLGWNSYESHYVGCFQQGPNLPLRCYPAHFPASQLLLFFFYSPLLSLLPKKPTLFSIIQGPSARIMICNKSRHHFYNASRGFTVAMVCKSRVQGGTMWYLHRT